MLRIAQIWNESRRRLEISLTPMNDVAPSVDCQRQSGRIDKLICEDDSLRLIEQLDTKAWVYAYENATKTELNHRKTNLDENWIKSVRNKCKDRACLCAAFRDHTNDSMGGTSLYEQYEIAIT
jgi:uncharacterized protein